jgi:hypothetical protein
MMMLSPAFLAESTFYRRPCGTSPLHYGEQGTGGYHILNVYRLEKVSNKVVFLPGMDVLSKADKGKKW